MEIKKKLVFSGIGEEVFNLLEERGAFDITKLHNKKNKTQDEKEEMYIEDKINYFRVGVLLGRLEEEVKAILIS